MAKISVLRTMLNNAENTQPHHGLGHDPFADRLPPLDKMAREVRDSHSRIVYLQAEQAKAEMKLEEVRDQLQMAEGEHAVKLSEFDQAAKQATLRA